MKSFIKKLFIFLSGAVIFIIVASFIDVGVYSYFNADEQTLTLKDYSNIQDNFHSDKNKEVNLENIKQLDRFISALPPNVAKVYAKDWVFIVTDKIPLKALKTTDKEVPGVSDSSDEDVIISGVCNWHTRVVFLQSEPDAKRFETIFVHELGHCFDYEFGSLSSTDAFKTIYLLYKDTYVEQALYSPEKYAASSESEFFATLFKEYFISPNSLKLQAPEAYDYIDTVYKEVSGDDSADTTIKYDLQSVIIKLKNEFKKLQSDM